MLLSLQPLKQVQGVNTWTRIHAWEFNQGSAPVWLYFQLVDAAADTVEDGYTKFPGRRYVPASGSWLYVNIHNVNDAYRLIKVATQPWPLQDPSLWNIVIEAKDVQPLLLLPATPMQVVPSAAMLLGAPDLLLLLGENSAPGLAALTGTLAASANGVVVTFTAGGGAAFVAPPPQGAQMVIGVDSGLYAQSSSLGGYYVVTLASTSTQIVASKVSDLFYSGLTTPVTILATPVVSVADLHYGVAVKTSSGLLQGKMRVSTSGQYNVPYRSAYQDIINDNQTGWGA